MKATRRKGGAMKDSELYELELIAAAALRSLERDGLIESFIGDDGEVWWRHTAAGKKAMEKGDTNWTRNDEHLPTMRSINKEGTMTINSTTTITVTVGDKLDIECDPPDTSPHTAGPLLLKAAWGEAIRGGMSRATFVSTLRGCADQIEAMTDEQYTAGHYGLDS